MIPMFCPLQVRMLADPTGAFTKVMRSPDWRAGACDITSDITSGSLAVVFSIVSLFPICHLSIIWKAYFLIVVNE